MGFSFVEIRILTLISTGSQSGSSCGGGAIPGSGLSKSPESRKSVICCPIPVGSHVTTDGLCGFDSA